MYSRCSIIYSEALVTDANAVRSSLDPALFPGVSSSVEVHEGFGGEQAKYIANADPSFTYSLFFRTATQILSAVQTAMAAHGSSHVTIVGHSLGTVPQYPTVSTAVPCSHFIGAAIALIDAVYLPLHLPGVTFTTIGYGMPRVGNFYLSPQIHFHSSP